MSLVPLFWWRMDSSWLNDDEVTRSPCQFFRKLSCGNKAKKKASRCTTQGTAVTRTCCVGAPPAESILAGGSLRNLSTSTDAGESPHTDNTVLAGSREESTDADTEAYEADPRPSGGSSGDRSRSDSVEVMPAWRSENLSAAQLDSFRAEHGDSPRVDDSESEVSQAASSSRRGPAYKVGQLIAQWETKAAPAQLAPHTAREARRNCTCHCCLMMRTLSFPYAPPPMEALPWKPHDYKLVKKLQEAKRNSGCVELMRHIETGRFVAIKRMPLQWVTDSAHEFAEKFPRSAERPWVDIGLVRALHKRGYEFVCEPFGVFKDHTDVYVVSEFATEGDLFGWCQTEGSPMGREREDVVRPLAWQVLSAVQWLHKLGIAHRDVSLENLVLTKNEEGEAQIKLIDFGMATMSRIATNEICGKPSYQAPEMHDGGTYDTFLADSFALGVTLYCMAVGDYPWISTKPGADAIFKYVRMNGLAKFFSVRKLRGGAGQRLPEVFSIDFLDLLQRLMATSASERNCVASSCYDASGRLLPSVMDCVWFNC